MTKPLTFHDIASAIQASLTPDLLEKKYREQLTADDPPETGHCAIASEAFYHFAGGKEAGFVPAVVSYAADGKGHLKFGDEKEAAFKKGWRRDSHWWIRGPKNGARGEGKLFDVTAAQFRDAFPYEKGHNTGFMQPQQKPSKRAKILMARVEDMLGKEVLEEFRRNNISAYRAAARLNPPTHTSHRAARSPRI